MIARRSGSSSLDQAAISMSVRPQPTQKPLRPSTAQTLTQGVEIGFAAMGEGLAGQNPSANSALEEVIVCRLNNLDYRYTLSYIDICLVLSGVGASGGPSARISCSKAGKGRLCRVAVFRGIFQCASL